MLVKVNGKDVEAEENISLENFLKEKNIDFKTVVVEYNLDILKDITGIMLKDEDNIEILKIVGGG